MKTTLQGTKIPFTQKWYYTLYLENGVAYDSFVSTKKLDAEEMISVQVGYSEALDAYSKLV